MQEKEESSNSKRRITIYRDTYGELILRKVSKTYWKRVKKRDIHLEEITTSILENTSFYLAAFRIFTKNNKSTKQSYRRARKVLSSFVGKSAKVLIKTIYET